MRRPGYLADWDQDLNQYLQTKYPGWKPNPVWYGPYLARRQYPQPSWDCPTEQLLDPVRGCLPEAAIIETALKLD